MVKVKKRDGSTQEFDRNKLEDSLRKAGATDNDAARVTESIARRIRDGTETSEIKNQVVSELKRTDDETAEKYEAFKFPLYQTT